MQGCTPRHRKRSALPGAARSVALVALLGWASLWGWASIGPAAEPNASGSATTGAVWPDSFRDDATLRDVFFVDPLVGWAVGDRGVIWHSTDGGKSWQMQSSRVSDRLDSVGFIDRQRGWVAGGKTSPYLHRSTGTLLKTTDAGATWTLVKDQYLPWIHQIILGQDGSGLLIADPTPMYPSGLFLFRTDQAEAVDQVRTVAGRSPGWIGGVAVDGGGFLLIDHREQVYRLHHATLSPTKLGQTDSVGTRPSSLFAITRGPGNLLWGAGIGGDLRPLGNARHAPNHQADRWQEFDWLTAASQPDRLGNWYLALAGSPGSHVLHSSDSGDTWQKRPTGISTPLYAIDFVNKDQGWAVGSLGKILRTDNGGTTWQSIRGAERHVAVLAIYPRWQDVDWSVLAQLAVAENYRVGLEILAAEPEPAWYDRFGVTSGPVRLAEVMSQLGGAEAFQTHLLAAPTSSIGPLPIGHSSARPTIVGRQEAIGYIAQRIRLWQPELVLIPGPSHASHQRAIRLESLIREALIQAATEGTDALGPWEVSSLLVAEPTHVDRPGGYRVHGDRLAMPLGRTVSSLAAAADRLLGGQEPNALAMRRVAVTLRSDGDATGTAKLRIAAERLTSVRRPPAAIDTSLDLLSLRRSALQRRTAQAILTAAERGNLSNGSLVVVQQIGRLADPLDQQEQAELLFAAATQLWHAGDGTSAIQLAALLVDRLPKHPLSEVAKRWQWQKLVSREMAVHHPLPANVESERLQRAVQIATQLRQTYPPLNFDAPFLAATAALNLQSGNKLEATANYRRILSSYPNESAWHGWAERQITVDSGTHRADSSDAIIASAATRPLLDGQLVEPTWQGSPTLTMSDTDVFLRHDRQFLYIGVRAQTTDTDTRLLSQITVAQPSPATHEDDHTDDLPESPTRQRDTDLSDLDHVVLYLDIDRDATTYWRLEIDQRGWAGDAINADRSWDPTWYIAAKQRPGEWTVEAAIGWDQLLGTNAPPSDPIGLAAERISPTQRRAWKLGPDTPRILGIATVPSP